MYELCDADNAAKATVHVVLQSGRELFFCSGHYQQHLPKLHDTFVRIETRDSFPQKQLLSTV
jgi:hypothetical protein